MDLTGYTGLIRIRLRAVAAGGPRGDIAVDNIEVSGVPVYGDMNAANIVNGSDFPDFVVHWLQVNCNLDLDDDCVITLHELSRFAGNWLDDSYQ